jgi:hypothetical protein
MASNESGKSIGVSSLVGLMTKEALVQVQIGAEKVQLSPSEARDVALNLLECAAASVADLFFVEFAMQKIGTDMNGAAHLLQSFRMWRQTQEGEPS